MPSAKLSTATTVNLGFEAKTLKLKRKSCQRFAGMDQRGKPQRFALAPESSFACQRWCAQAAKLRAFYVPRITAGKVRRCDACHR